MTKCFVEACKSSDRKHVKGVTFHKIPVKNAKRWLHSIRRPLNTLLNYQRVCSLHFNADEFDRTGEKTRLKPNAVPSKNLVPAGPPALPKILVSSNVLTENSKCIMEKRKMNQLFTTQPERFTSSNPDLPCASTIKDQNTKGLYSSHAVSVASSLECFRKLVTTFHTYSRSPKDEEFRIKTHQGKVMYFQRKLEAVKIKSLGLSKNVQDLPADGPSESKHLISNSGSPAIKWSTDCSFYPYIIHNYCTYMFNCLKSTLEYCCPSCGYKTTLLVQLKGHIGAVHIGADSFHEGIIEYKCLECPLQTFSQLWLLRHYVQRGIPRNKQPRKRFYHMECDLVTKVRQTLKVLTYRRHTLPI